MGIKTRIEWADSTVNPIMGCTGCALRKNHCYAATLCTRYAGHKGWPKSFDQPEFFPGRLEKAVKWSNLTGKDRPDEPWLNGLPRHVFVNDLSDGFCPDVDPWQWLAPSIPSMHLSPHVWLLLTKWPDRMNKFFREWGKPIPSNFYLGVSVGNQEQFDSHWYWASQIPAAVLFVSCEPLLGLVTFNARDWERLPDWVICGGESGPGARPMHPDRARSLRDQCQAASVPFFFKQWGAFTPYPPIELCRDDNQYQVSLYGGYWPIAELDRHACNHQAVNVYRVGKKTAGHLLDGREHHEFPRTSVDTAPDS